MPSEGSLTKESETELTGRPAGTAVWQGAAELGVDLTAAITAALDCGSLSAMSASVIYLHYFIGLSMEEIGDALKLSYDQVRRSHKKALKAIRNTGLLDGYS